MQLKSPPHWPNAAWMAQLNAWSKKNCVSAQPCARQLATHETLTVGGCVFGSMHLIAHVNAAKQLSVVHWPQSPGQFEHVSNDSHFLLPHTEQTPQSCGHEIQFSVDEHVPSPQPAHLPQSSGQVKQLSSF